MKEEEKFVIGDYNSWTDDVDHRLICHRSGYTSQPPAYHLVGRPIGKT
jgi:hypothetical protein